MFDGPRGDNPRVTRDVEWVARSAREKGTEPGCEVVWACPCQAWFPWPAPRRSVSQSLALPYQLPTLPAGRRGH